MQVKEIMDQNVDVINCEKTVVEAAQMMERGDYGSLPVEENEKMIGMITDRDITVRVVAAGKNPEDVKVRECMTEGIEWCYEDDEVEDVLDKMKASQHGRIPIVNRDKRLVGILTLGHIAKKTSNPQITDKIIDTMSLH